VDGQLLEVVLGAASPLTRAGEALSISVTVRNVSGRPLWMVGVLDGSEAGYRFPHYVPSVTGPKPLLQREQPWCGTALPLRLQDLRHLGPGEHFDPTVAIEGAAYQPLATFRDFRAPFPGQYQFHLTISTEVRDEGDWGGILAIPSRDTVLERLATVPRLRVESNVLGIEFR